MNPLERYDIPVEIRKNKKLSILMPFYNEEKVIVKNIYEVIKAMEYLDFNYEIVLINDGSSDCSYEFVIQEFRNYDKIKIARNYQNFGKGWAIKTGYEYSSGDYILFLDSDLELSPYHIPNFYRIMIESGADAVIGSKLHPDSRLFYPLKRRIISFVYYSIIKLFFGLPVMDSQTGIKLFKREALETSLPKVLVKKFAFDIELLIVLYKNYKTICPAPIELNFKRGAFGNIKFKTIKNTFFDTLAVFYRDKILRFYNRPLGENIKYFYTIILFSELNDDYERDSLIKYLNINYDSYDVILSGKSNFDIVDPRLIFIKSDKISFTDRLKEILDNNIVQGEYAVFSKLDAYPDERFLFNVGRILSLENVGSAGGYVELRADYTPFEFISYTVIKSFFLNLNLMYRYKPMNFIKVDELQLYGLFINKKLLENFGCSSNSNLKVEFILSKLVQQNKLSMVYSPDIMLYKKFPISPGTLINFIKNEAFLRSIQIREKTYHTSKYIHDLKFIVSVFFILFLMISIIFTIILKNLYYFLPLICYLGFVFLTRIYLYGFRKGIISSFFLLLSQVLYGLDFIRGILGFKKAAFKRRL